VRRFCANPFEHLEVMPDGTAYACCPGWQPRPIGNVVDEGPRAVWEGLYARDVRISVLDGSFRRCKACPFLATSTGPVQQVAEDADLSAYPLVPPGPRYLNLAVDLACNLACPSCRVAPHRSSPADRDRVRRVQAAALSEGILEGLDWLSVSGSGDPFASAPHLELLRTLSPARLPGLKLRLHTNGLLLDETAWAGLGEAREMVRAIEVSVDAATPETYAVNRGGDWGVLQRNLAFVAGLRRGGPLETLQLSFVTQANNWREAPAFVEMGRGLGADAVLFTALRNWGTFREEDFAARAVHLPEHPERDAMRALFAREPLSAPPALVGGLLDPAP